MTHPDFQIARLLRYANELANATRPKPKPAVLEDTVSVAQVRVLEALFNARTATTRQIARWAQMRPARIRDAIDGLRLRGLVTSAGRSSRYREQAWRIVRHEPGTVETRNGVTLPRHSEAA